MASLEACKVGANLKRAKVVEQMDVAPATGYIVLIYMHNMIKI